MAWINDFNSHHPCGWRRTILIDKDGNTYISTHTTHVGGDGKFPITCMDSDISTHTTHVGGDKVGTVTMTVKMGISTHTTHVGGDHSCVLT